MAAYRGYDKKSKTHKKTNYLKKKTLNNLPMMHFQDTNMSTSGDISFSVLAVIH